MRDIEKLKFIKKYLKNPPTDIHDDIYTNDKCKCKKHESYHMTNGKEIFCGNCRKVFKARWKSKDCIKYINELIKTLEPRKESE